ncbi:sodium:solute symporter family protein [Oceanobacillus jeddahense]|uniref:Sodium:solute symporter family protein n=1 Tax=Oceanobacillus jeddahense TaxID=1462527 RepID=A0ABY5JSI7_9BACI|nr:sodium:solute symporter family protein [Oceanobacillus jeddahense]UUI02036.1 sodium:solute symporter family protein [Oceanobacillus jeddahense]
MNLYMVAVIAYLVFMALLGVYFSKKSIKNSEDFIVAGRSLPLLVVIGTLLATAVGSGTVIGGASFIYQYGPIAAIFNLSGGFLAALVLFFIAGKVRKGGSYTVPQMIEIRFGSKARLIASLLIIFAYVGIAAYQFTGGAYVLQLTIGVPLEVGTLIMAALVIFLTVSGGLFSVAYTDAISAFLIIVGFLIGVPYVLNEVGWLSGLASSLPSTQASWNGGLSIPQLIGFFLPLFLLILGDQNMYQRFSASKNESVAKKSTIGFFITNVIVIALTIILATTAIVIFPNITPDTAILEIAVSGVPVAIGMFILSAAVAFLITTATSYLLSASGNVVYDLVQKYSKTQISDKKLLWLNRSTVLTLGILAYVLGQFFPSVLAMQMYAYTMYGAALTPAILATLLWKKATTAGIISSMIAGGVGTILWEIVWDKPFDWNSVLFALPLSLLALIIVSSLTNNNQINTEFDKDFKEYTS